MEDIVTGGITVVALVDVVVGPAVMLASGEIAMAILGTFIPGAGLLLPFVVL